MPVTVEVIDSSSTEEMFETVFSYFEYIDGKFSTYKADSEISLINNHELVLANASEDMKTVFDLAEKTRIETDGFFDIKQGNAIDPSGLVKGWAIQNAFEILRKYELKDFYIEAGGDIQASGKNSQGQNWRIGIRSPFDCKEIVKILCITDRGVATSGTYVRGQHIYNPKNADQLFEDVKSLTVIGPNIFEADRFATAAFAMGREGINFIERLGGFEGYMIDSEKSATFTSGFERLVLHA